MATTTLKARLISNNATSAQWAASNPTPLKGELCLETDTRKFKFGNGTTAYNSLPYASAKMAEVRNINPGTSDKDYDIGQVWINTNTKQAYVLLSIVGSTATWGRMITSADGAITADNAETANRLATPHTIAGHSFDGTQDITISASDVGAIPASEKGTNGGVASLDSSGKVPQSQLPSYVDDVLEFSAKSSFPATGESGKIYVDTTTNKTYRWGSSAYVEISASLAIGETESSAFAGNRGLALETDLAAHKARTDNPHNVTKAQVGLGNVDNTSDANKPISNATQSALNNKLGVNDNINVNKLYVGSGDTFVLDGSIN